MFLHRENNNMKRLTMTTPHRNHQPSFSSAHDDGTVERMSLDAAQEPTSAVQNQF